MSIVLSDQGGSILDHNLAVGRAYHSYGSDILITADNELNEGHVQQAEECNLPKTFKAVTDKKESMSSTVSLQLRRGFFALHVPFMMDSQFEKVFKCLFERPTNCGEDPVITVRDLQQILADRKQRKRKKPAANCTVKEEKEKKQLLQVHTSLTATARQQGIFLEHLPNPLNNNELSRQCAHLDRDGDTFVDLLIPRDSWQDRHKEPSCVIDQKTPLVIDSSGRKKFTAEELIHRRVEHPCKEMFVVSVDNVEYILPPSVVFLLSDLRSFCTHLYMQIVDDGFDLIVVDPPWENKSVKRKKSYDMVGELTFQELPVFRLSRPGCLVALWVTNNERLEDFAVEELFPAWGLQLVGIWHWLKVTQMGDMVTSMTEGHKKPYEILLLGRAVDRTKSSSLDLSQEGDGDKSAVKDPPKSHVIISVPCSLHSKKVPLADVLAPYLPQNPRCLELFARNLWPGWTSWGREALRHQNMILYEGV